MTSNVFTPASVNNAVTKVNAGLSKAQSLLNAIIGTVSIIEPQATAIIGSVMAMIEQARSSVVNNPPLTLTPQQIAALEALDSVFETEDLSTVGAPAPAPVPTVYLVTLSSDPGDTALRNGDVVYSNGSSFWIAPAELPSATPPTGFSKIRTVTK